MILLSYRAQEKGLSRRVLRNMTSSEAILQRPFDILRVTTCRGAGARPYRKLFITNTTAGADGVHFGASESAFRNRKSHTNASVLATSTLPRCWIKRAPKCRKLVFACLFVCVVLLLFIVAFRESVLATLICSFPETKLRFCRGSHSFDFAHFLPLVVHARATAIRQVIVGPNA